MKEAVADKKAEGGVMRHRMVREIETHLRAPCLVVTQYRGLSVKELEELRKRLRTTESRYLVAKNSLSRIALKSLGAEALIPLVTDQVGFVVGCEDPIAISRVVVGYMKDHEALKLAGGLADGKLLSADRIREFARLPSREVLIGKTVMLVKSPLSGLAAVLSGTVRKLLYALKEIRKTKEGGGTS